MVAAGGSRWLGFEARFWAQISPEPNTGCWLWIGAVNDRGYGQIRRDGKKVRAHRAAWELLVGPAPELLDHRCNVKICVNPQHLQPSTWWENTRRADSPPAVNAAKTHCSRGHEFTPENTAPNTASSGKVGRKCRACARIHQETFRLKHQRERAA